MPHTKPKRNNKKNTICRCHESFREQFFEQYNLATETTINITKTTITPLANTKKYKMSK